MSPKTPVTALVSLTVTRFSTSHDDFSRVTCLSCDIGLDLHQPDPGSPDRLLGICAGCQHWFILEVLTDQDGVVMVMVPEARDFLRIGGLVDGPEGQ